MIFNVKNIFTMFLTAYHVLPSFGQYSGYDGPTGQSRHGSLRQEPVYVLV